MCKSERKIPLQKFVVTITETLRKTVDVEASCLNEAEQLVSRDWQQSKYILGASDFADVEFEAEPATDKRPLLERSRCVY